MSQKMTKICYDEIEIGKKKFHCQETGHHHAHRYVGSVAEPLRGGGSKLTKFIIEWKTTEIENEIS